MNDTDIIWTKKLIEKVDENSVNDVIEWVGNVYENYQRDMKSLLG